MFKDILVYIKYPHAVVVVTTIWIGTLALYRIDRHLPIISMVIIDSLVTAGITRHAMK